MKRSQCVHRLSLGGFLRPTETAAADISTMLVASQWPDGVGAKEKSEHVNAIKQAFANTPAQATQIARLPVYPYSQAQLAETHDKPMFGDSAPVPEKLQGLSFCRAKVSFRKSSKRLREVDAGAGAIVPSSQIQPRMTPMNATAIMQVGLNLIKQMCPQALSSFRLQRVSQAPVITLTEHGQNVTRASVQPPLRAQAETTRHQSRSLEVFHNQARQCLLSWSKKADQR